jgi:hemerythrin
MYREDCGMLIEWDNKFEIGHERIDSEHRIFLGLIKDLDRAIANGDSRDRIRRVLDEIQLYARFHFVSEENIMTDVDYPALDAHRGEHARLLSLLEDRVQSYRMDPANSGVEIVEFMFSWFALHTTHEDKKIAGFLAARH